LSPAKIYITYFRNYWSGILKRERKIKNKKIKRMWKMMNIGAVTYRRWSWLDRSIATHINCEACSQNNI
jgi:hypothetical protein